MHWYAPSKDDCWHHKAHLRVRLMMSIRVAESTERDYFTLRERIETVTRQLTGLQEYVRTQCFY
ncbi:hypothetical protein BME27_15350 [Klebsiella pneumoniae]|nr:hypothetical protein BME27_15350 [Klebsiella pneumoniae]HBQ7532143.1 lysis protein [Klebsiella pneumoniae]HBQ7926542.1 lysis protein [Klebsiella pneumoniae]HBQ7957995.1 lysis protein [Klebsiella pneumoniae]HBT1927625.1 hypothetical protein [Klebsiella pneumoniae]